MRKICLLLIFLLILSTVVYGANMALQKSLSLGFNGATATCKTTIEQYNSSIDVTMELYRGSTLVKYWHKSGTDSVSLDKQWICISGQTYTLQADVTVDGNPVYVPPVTKTCP